MRIGDFQWKSSIPTLSKEPVVTTSVFGSTGGDQADLAQSAAFELLAEIVTENHQAGRRSFGASVKPELRRRTSGGFDERRLGFMTFGSFLRAAAAAGVVDIHKAPRGPDVILAPPGQTPIVEPPTLAGRHRIRPDLWECFVDWDERYQRVYDEERDVAIRFPSHPTALDPPDQADLRTLIVDKPERFHPIEPVSFTGQLDWMREFVNEQLDSPVRTELQTAMASARPARAFTIVLNSHPSLRAEWAARRLALVEAQIRQWAEREQLTALEITETVEEPPQQQAAHDRAAASAATSDEDERLVRMRDHVKRAIDRMPAAELERLPIPFGYSFEG
ncbi:MAG TPA: UPF0158 family protein [Solirubrobacteraceae bacterium]|nr:UPF0158 family protein [Solirubrobacteraceae bacterium]